MVDYGYPQVTRTENLKAFVYNEPIVVTSVPNTGKMINPKTASANAVHKPVIGSVNAKGKSVNSDWRSCSDEARQRRVRDDYLRNGYNLIKFFQK